MQSTDIQSFILHTVTTTSAALDIIVINPYGILTLNMKHPDLHISESGTNVLDAQVIVVGCPY